MALAFVGESSDRVSVGTAASFDNVNVGTAIFLAYPTSTALGGQLFLKGTFPAQNRSGIGYGSDLLEYRRDRATVDAAARGNLADFANHSVNNWNWYAAVWNTGGVSGDQKLYIGNLTAAFAEPSSYVIQDVGSGAPGDNAGTDCRLGNVDGATPASGFPGRIARAILYNVALTLAQLKAIQFGGAIFPGRIGHWELGYNGTATQPDWSGSFNAGTVTGATQAAHAPVRILPFGRLTEPTYSGPPSPFLKIQFRAA